MHHNYKKPKDIQLRDDGFIEVRKNKSDHATIETIHAMNGRKLHIIVTYSYTDGIYVWDTVTACMDKTRVSVPVCHDDVLKTLEFFEDFVKKNNLEYYSFVKRIWNSLLSIRLLFSKEDKK